MMHSSKFNSWQCAQPQIQMLRPSQPVSYNISIPRMPNIAASASAATHQPHTFDAEQQVDVVPVASANVSMGMHTASQGLKSHSQNHQYQTHSLSYTDNTFPSPADKLFLNPEAQTFTPGLRTNAVEFQPQFPNLTEPQSISHAMKITSLTNSPSQQLRAPIIQTHPNSNVRLTSSIPVPTTMKTQEVASSACPSTKNPHLLSVIKDNVVSAATAVSQTELSGVDWDAKLCGRCKESLFGHGAGSIHRAAPTFVKLKDISMQHKLKYLAIKAAVFVRESPSILTQPQELKCKLLNRLSKMCSHFGAESHISLSWQDDIACSVAINLLAEEPELSSSHNNSRFLQQLKIELESYMEIAQDILNHEKETTSIPKAIQSTVEAQSSHTTTYQATSCLNHNTFSDNLVMSQNVDNLSGHTANFGIENALTSQCTLTSSNSEHRYNENNNSASASRANSVFGDSSIQRMCITDMPPLFASDKATDSISNINCAVPDDQINSQIDNENLLSNIGMGSISTKSNLPLSLDNALNSNLITPVDNALNDFSVPNINAIGSNTQFSPLLSNPLFISDPVVATNFLNNNLQCDASQGLLMLQQKYLEMLKQAKTLNEQSISTSMNSLGVAELSSDKFVSQISQNVADFKLDPHSSSLTSPSLSIDDDMSMGSSGQDRVRHLSSSTSNSDSDHKTMKKKQQDLIGKVGTKKMAPLDFRKAKSGLDKRQSDFGAKLGALYVSVTSHDAQGEVHISNSFMDESSIQSCKEEMAKSSEPKPIRRLTPLQRKLLKKGEQSSDRCSAPSDNEKFKSLLLKTAELDERLHSHQPSGDTVPTLCPMQGPVATGEAEDEWRKIKNPFISCNTDSSTPMDYEGCLSLDLPAHSRIESEFMKRLKSKKLLHAEPGTQKEATKSPAHHDDPIDARTLRAIGEELASDFNSESDRSEIVNDEMEEFVSQAQLPVEMAVDENDEDIPTHQSSVSQCEVIPPTLDRQSFCDDGLTNVECRVGQAVDKPISFTPSYSEDIPGCDYDLTFQTEGGTEQSSSQFQSYSDIVKQKPVTKSSMVVLRPSDFNDDEMGLARDSNIDVRPLAVSSETDGNAGLRTWSSLFHTNDKKINPLPVPKEKCQAVKDALEVKSKNGSTVKCDDEGNSCSTSQNEVKFGKYGLDDFSSTPPKLRVKVVKTTEAGKGDDEESKAEEQKKSSEESEWKMVTKKSKKAVASQEMDVLLKAFRTEDQYAELCKAIAERHSRISVKTAGDVLETVFVEMEGLTDMAEWEVLEEVDVALSHMCPQQLEAADKANAEEAGSIDKKSE